MLLFATAGEELPPLGQGFTRQLVWNSWGEVSCCLSSALPRYQLHVEMAPFGKRVYLHLWFPTFPNHFRNSLLFTDLPAMDFFFLLSSVFLINSLPFLATVHTSNHGFFPFLHSFHVAFLFLTASFILPLNQCGLLGKIFFFL